MVLDKFAIRTLVTVLFGPTILFLAWLGGYYFLTLVSLMSLLGLNEFYHLVQKKGANALDFLGLASGLAICLTVYFRDFELVWLVLIITIILTFLFELFRKVGSPTLNVSVTLSGVLFVALPFAFMIAIRELPASSVLPASGAALMILLFLCVWVCDSAAYILGSRLGRHKLFERVSPNKTIEGTLSGFVFSLLTAYVCGLTFLNGMQLGQVLVIGAICGSFGQVSDLVESLLKRDAEVKDSSGLIPGHGGILDRFDSEILVAPTVYLYLRYWVAA